MKLFIISWIELFFGQFNEPVWNLLFVKTRVWF